MYGIISYINKDKNLSPDVVYEFLYSLKFLRISFFCLYQEIARDFKGHEDKSAVDGRSNETGAKGEKG